MDKFHFYINFPSDCDIVSPEAGEELLKELQLSIDRADCETGSNLYYSSTNKEEFIGNAEALMEFGYFGTMDLSEVLNFHIINCDIKDWEKKHLHHTNDYNCRYKHILPDGEDAPNTPKILKEIAEHLNQIADPAIEKCLLINPLNNIEIFNPGTVMRIERNINPQLFHLESTNDFLGLELWIHKTRRRKSYNFNDNRHIEGHPQYIKGKSPNLYGSGGRASAEALLETSIGDKRKNTYTINFDYEKQCYIRFEYENASNQYHGYHIIKPRTHDVDHVNIANLPNRVKNILKYRKEKEPAK